MNNINVKKENFHEVGEYVPRRNLLNIRHFPFFHVHFTVVSAFLCYDISRHMISNSFGCKRR